MFASSILKGYVPMSSTRSALRRRTATLALTLAFASLAFTGPALADSHSPEDTSGGPSTMCCGEFAW
jgi:hypothetical protein